MTFDEYLALPGMNWSSIKTIERSPKHFKHALANPIDDTPRLGIGRAFHTLVLEPERFDEDYSCFHGGRRAGKYWDAFVEASEGKTVLKPDEINLAQSMAFAIRTDPASSPLFYGPGENELVIQWTDKASGLQCKARIDRLTGNALIDLKSTQDAGARRFGSIASRLMYWRQIVWYLDGVAAWRAERDLPALELAAKLVAVELEAPHDVVVYYLTEEQMYMAREANAAMVAKLVECQTGNAWPGVAGGVEQPLLLPAYEYFSEEGDPDGLGLDLDGINEEAAA